MLINVPIINIYQYLNLIIPFLNKYIITYILLTIPHAENVYIDWYININDDGSSTSNISIIYLKNEPTIRNVSIATTGSIIKYEI